LKSLELRKAIASAGPKKLNGIAENRSEGVATVFTGKKILGDRKEGGDPRGVYD